MVGVSIQLEHTGGRYTALRKGSVVSKSSVVNFATGTLRTDGQLYWGLCDRVSVRLASVVSEGLTRQGNASYIFRP